MSVRRLAIVTITCLTACVPAVGQAPAQRPTGASATCVTLECHNDVLSGSVLHGPAAQKKYDACHEDTDWAAHLFTLTARRAELSAFCHVQTHRSIVHEPVAKGDCTGCHDPHGSNHRFLLVDDPAGGLCFRCHPLEEFQNRKYVHGPVAAGACVVCHEAHSS